MKYHNIEEVSEQITIIKLDTKLSPKGVEWGSSLNKELNITRTLWDTIDALEMKCCSAHKSNGECCVWQQHTPTTFKGQWATGK